MERLKAPEPEIVKAALEMLKTEIRSSTSSMTAVPKPLKFLRQHRTTLVETHASMAAGPNKVRESVILSTTFCCVFWVKRWFEGRRVWMTFVMRVPCF